ncbi:hypothetical protein L1049_005842 [Liquidambar formosana]|uniref:Cytochrome P450 n=1 Tax=Liquidambar formosana TaxID=63359 RepID=A0AAP0WSC1_LIQFO
MTRLFLWVDQILDSIVDQRVKMNTASGEEAFNNERKDFLQLLLDLKKQEDSATPISMTQIMALLMDIVVGGTDTTATMAEWVMAEMMCNPEVMKKAQEELAEVVGMNNIVEEAHLPKLLTVFGCSCEGDIPSTRASPTPSPTVS